MRIAESKLRSIIRDEIRKAIEQERLYQQKKTELEAKNKPKTTTSGLTKDKLKTWCSKNGFSSFENVLRSINRLNAAEKGKLNDA